MAQIATKDAGLALELERIMIAGGGSLKHKGLNLLLIKLGGYDWQLLVWRGRQWIVERDEGERIAELLLSPVVWAGFIPISKPRIVSMGLNDKQIHVCEIRFKAVPQGRAFDLTQSQLRKGRDYIAQARTRRSVKAQQKSWL